jgi:3-oxoacyl-[acyl-carrier-protein] synthase-3
VGCAVAGTGKCLPRLAVSNDDMAGIVETSDEWIVQRTGINIRRISLGESTTDLAYGAARAALGMAVDAEGNPVDPLSIDLLVCMTVTPDTSVPSQASLLKERLGLDNAVAFDLNAACSGCVYGIAVAESMMRASYLVPGRGNDIRRALVVGAERLSRIVDWTDRATCVLFGDGAGSVLLEWRPGRPGILSTFMKNTDDVERVLNRGALYDLSTFPFGRMGERGDALPPQGDEGLAGIHGGPQGVSSDPLRKPFITMAGKKVFRFAVSAIVEAVQVVLERAGVGLEDVALIVPHQANERIISYAAKRLGLPISRFQVSIGEHANTSAASALMALDDAYAAGRIVPGDKVIMVAFGGGLTSGAVLFEA